MGYEEWASSEPILSSFLLAAPFISASFMKNKKRSKALLEDSALLAYCIGLCGCLFLGSFWVLNLSAYMAASLSLTPEAL